MLQSGRYHEAVEAYHQWEQGLQRIFVYYEIPRIKPLEQLQALLGQAACHLLGMRGLSLPAKSGLSEGAGQQAYRQARELLVQVTEPASLIASCWEGLGDYGGWLGRYDLMQEGYERALAVLEPGYERTQQERICQAYLAQARIHADRLLCQQLEERLAAWHDEENVPVIAPFSVEQLTSRQTLTGHTGTVYRLAISRDGQLLVSGSVDGTVKVWDLSTGKEVRTLTGHESSVYSIAISPDGRTLVSGSHDKTIKVWDLSTGEELRTLTSDSAVWGIAISPDGQTLVTGGVGSTIKVWGV